MKVINFQNFVNERVQIKVFDIVINKDGAVVYNNEGYPIKGKLDTHNRRILGYDGDEYIAAIDRGGNLFSFLDVDTNNNILLNGKRVKVIYETTRRSFWNKEENYSGILPILPTGLVNVKVDMEVIKKTRRFSRGISRKLGIAGLIDRLKVLSRELTHRSRSTETIQREMSAIMMLHYLNELKGHFDPSSAGFLFESYIAGLITGSMVKEDNSPIDVEDSTGKKYQIKLLEFREMSASITTLNDEYLDYYIIAFKFADKIKIFILDGKDQEADNYINNFKVKTANRAFSFSKFREYKDTTNDFIYDIDILNIDKKIDNIAKGLKEVLTLLYSSLSKFQFNVETILTGVNENGDIISEQQFGRIGTDSNEHLNTMRAELNKLLGIIK
jgi:hypothetical protein